MKAIIETGGKQYYVEEGTELYIEKLDLEAGSKVEFDKVLMVDGAFGHPYLTNAKVTGEVVKHGKEKKVVVLNMFQKINTVKNKDTANHIQRLLLNLLK